MFGFYRYALAFCVAISHLWAGMIGGPAAYSVWGFYCLSGYLMTLILNEKYGFSPRGLFRFAFDRALRIYPAYYVVCAAMFVLFLLVPETSSRFLPNLRMPQTSQGWWYTLLLLPPHDGNELLHGSLALRVELWFYVGMSLGLARSRRIAWAWFAASSLYTLWLLALRTPFPERYVFIPACSLAFSLGSLIYHERERIPAIKSARAVLLAACLWWLHVWVAQHVPYGPLVFGLYSSLLFSGLAIAALMRLDPRACPPWVTRLDRLAGNLSYPIYLCHWGVGISVTWLLPGTSRADLVVFLLGFPLANLVAFLIYQHVERPLQHWKLGGIAGRPAAPEHSPAAVGASSRIDMRHRDVAGPATPARAGGASRKEEGSLAPP
jgi:peptidoglycan/LPS O-acetylase OafA/YrhL